MQVSQSEVVDQEPNINKEEGITSNPNMDKPIEVSEDSKELNIKAGEQVNAFEPKDKKSVYQEAFKRSLFIGDSITEGLSSYQLVGDLNVIAGKGLTALKAQRQVDKMMGLDIDNIFILLGVNDLLNGINSEVYASHYRELIESIRNKLPNIRIFVQATFPVAVNVETEKPGLTNKKIDEFNMAIKNMSLDEGVAFLDFSKSLKDDSGAGKNAYFADGIHLQYNTYALWLDYLKGYIN